MPYGTLDLQNLLAYGEADNGRQGRGPNGEYDRGQILCEWGRKFGIEGFVREEATFEVIHLSIHLSARSHPV